MSKEKETESLIRFYSNIEYALQCIETNEIALPHASTFNDPFDPNLNIYLKNSRILPQEEINNLRNTFKNIKETVCQNLFIACFSDFEITNHPNDHLYMWGHYGNGHRGVAIKFNCKPHLTSNKNGSLNKITYGPPKKIDRETLLDFGKNPLNEKHKVWQTNKENLLIKSNNWKPEKEYRLMARPQSPTEQKVIYEPLASNAMAAVYIGLRTSCSNRKRLIRACQRNNIEIYQYITKFGKMDIEAIKLNENL